MGNAGQEYRELGRVAELADAAYNRADGGAVNESNFSQGIINDYNIIVSDQLDGDVVYTFTDKVTGQATVVARGTDPLGKGMLTDALNHYGDLGAGNIIWRLGGWQYNRARAENGGCRRSRLR
ncbi:MAG: hypothetical protein JKY94_02405 [Rhodobacteraceae bacterium]|nr:hypothetical protein [Paracoccaceae bacterium]